MGTLEYEIGGTAAGRLVATARSLQVAYDCGARRAIPLPPGIRAALEAELAASAID
jgi:acyl-CoA thioesterase FadM